METAIRAKGLGKRFQQRHADGPRTVQQLLEGRGRGKGMKREAFWALRDASLEVQHGQMLGVIGQNGSGKSTLLRLLAGIMRPDEGHVATSDPVDGLLELNAGMHPDLTGRENIVVGGVLHGLLRRDVSDRFDEIVSFAELEEFIDAPVRTYSSGMKLRLGFSVAVHVEPKILLIDEVLAVGDMAFQQKCLDRIKAFKDKGCAIVLISHDLTQIKEMCDRALWLSHGRVLADGAPGDVVRAYKAAMKSETGRRTPFVGPERMTSQGRKLQLNENRFGSLEAEIIDVALLDNAGRPVETVAPGEGLIVRVALKASTKMPDYRLSVSIADSAEAICFDVNTETDRVIVPQLDGEVILSLHIERLDLGPGRYTLTVGLYHPNWSHAFDYHSSAYLLNVVGGPTLQGPLAPPRKWSVSK